MTTKRTMLLPLVLCCVLPCCIVKADAPTDQGGSTLVTNFLTSEEAAIGEKYANTAQLAAHLEHRPPAAAGKPPVMTIAAMLLLAALVFRLGAPMAAEYLNRRYDPWRKRSAKTSRRVCDAPSYEKFAINLAAGPSEKSSPTCASPARTASVPTEPAQGPAQIQPDPLEEFFQSAPALLGAIREAFSKFSGAPNRGADQPEMASLLSHVSALKGKSSRPMTLAVWQVACALEALLQQIANKPASATPSTLRTVAGAVDLLHALSVRGVKSQIASDPPVRLLAVDDDTLCRHAVSFALKKVLSQPDVAASGEAALALAEKQSYDLIFLDIEMPDMDGFELCSRIHATASNQTTPIVFVTYHQDLEARSRSALLGAQEMLSKPFLTFELALKALTMVLRHRLQAQAPRIKPKASAKVVAGLAEPVATTAAQSSPADLAAVRGATAVAAASP